jgi:hypothetical protein
MKVTAPGRGQVTWQLQADATLVVAWPGGALSAPLSVRRLRPPTDAEADAAVAWCIPDAAVELRCSLNMTDYPLNVTVYPLNVTV